MHIICPHCTTSYAIDLATLGVAGRTVRCSRCREVWLARPEDAIEVATPPLAMAEARQQAPASPPASNDDAAAEWDALAREDDGSEMDTPIVDSPSISGAGLDDGEASAPSTEDDWTRAARQYPMDAKAAPRQPQSRIRRLLQPLEWLGSLGKRSASLPIACAAMGALALGLVIWRVDVVRLLPQTAAFYKMVGLDVNLRGLRSKTSRSRPGRWRANRCW